MKTTELIQLLAELALKNYRDGIRPDPFAATAAHAIATAAAAKFSPESADAAAFVAVSMMIDLSKFSAHQAALATEARNATKNYHTKAGAPTDIKKIVPAFNELNEHLEKISFGQDASQIYDTMFASTESDNNHRLALKVAAATYMHGLACARSAYVHAVALAARYPEGTARDMVFKTAITKRLSSDLLNEPIEPSFFMSILCSDAMIIVGSILLIAGLAALSAGVAGLAVASIGALLASSVGLTSTTTVAAGVAMATAGSSFFAGRFFAAKQWQNDNGKSAQAVNDMNGVEYEGAPKLS